MTFLPIMNTYSTAIPKKTPIPQTNFFPRENNEVSGYGSFNGLDSGLFKV
jgi:hypothetical protein